ncbi:hypothetical protein ABK040_001604 [Willaertia magna]
MSEPIYLDYNATTPVHPKVAEEMIPYITKHFGNPSSSHHFGIQTKKAVTHSRIQVAQLLNCFPEEIIFTSGGTESNNYAIKGLIEEKLKHQSIVHCITSKIEHPSVMEVFKYLEQFYKDKVFVTYLNVNNEGLIDLEQLKQSLKKETILVSIMHSNNEVGTLQPIREIGKILFNFIKENNLNENSILFHTDAAQSIGKLLITMYKKQLYSTIGVNNNFNLDELKKKINEINPYLVCNFYEEDNDDSKIVPVHLMSIVSHKFYGPKGIGALFIRKNCGIQLSKQIHGASVHEKNFRSGTENVIELVGLGKACEVALLELPERINHMKECRDLLYKSIVEKLPKDFVKLNGHLENRLPNTLNISFYNIEANTLLDAIQDKIAASAGAACHSSPHEEEGVDEDSSKKIITVSQVLSEMKVPIEYAMGTIRFSTGSLLTINQVKEAANIIVENVTKLMPSNGDDEILNGEELSLLGEIKDIKLTSTTKGLGCGCKIRAQTLESVLKHLPKQPYNPNVLVGTETSDDCGVFKLSDELALCVTTDFFTPIVDSPKDFGAIACANALSDVYAQGGEPKIALNIVAFPVKRLPLKILELILLGAQEKANEANVQIIGGHSIEDNEAKFGMSVTGVVHPTKIWKNCGVKEGDVLLLTKPIGTGIITTALKKGMITSESDSGKKAIQWMSLLNKYASDVMHGKFRESKKPYEIHACTDVTGFGLLGHLKEMMTNEEQLIVEIDSSKVPLLDEVYELILSDIVPGGTINNINFVESITKYEDSCGNIVKTAICDAQTSGGLLFAIPQNEEESIMEDFKRQQISVWKIGMIKSKSGSNPYKIQVL